MLRPAFWRGSTIWIAGRHVRATADHANGFELSNAEFADTAAAYEDGPYEDDRYELSNEEIETMERYLGIARDTPGFPPVRLRQAA